LFAIYAVRVLERLTLGLLTMWTLLLMVMLLSCGLLTLRVIVNGAISRCKIWSENLVGKSGWKIWLENLVEKSGRNLVEHNLALNLALNLAQNPPPPTVTKSLPKKLP
jgi:hypothetical protein